MAGNTVTLTFAGDTKSLGSAVADVEKQTDRLTKTVSESGDRARQSAKGFGELEESAGKANQRFIGLGDSIAGPADIISKWKEGDLAGVAVGFADVAGGLEDFIIPTFSKIGPLITGTVIPAISSFATAVGTTLMAPLIAAGEVIFGTVVPAVWSFTAALLANPITWIVIGVVALIAILVLLINHFDLVQAAFEAVSGWIIDRIHDVGNFFAWLGESIPKWLGAAWDWITSTFSTVVGWIGQRLNDIGGFFARLGQAILAPFKWAFNEIATAWNKTIGSIHFTIPDWVPLIGGASFSVPRLPTFHTGGVVPGVPGSNVVAMLQAGEQVIPRTGAGLGGTAVVLSSDGSALADAIVEVVRKAVFRAGGDVQTALGV